MKLTFAEFLQYNQNQVDGYESTPQLHIDIANWLDSTKHKKTRLLQAFRHAGKSEIICAYVAWRLYLDPNYSVIIFSAIARIAKRNAQKIREYIEKNPLTKHLVPAVKKGQWQGTIFTVEGARGWGSVSCESLDSNYTGNHGVEMIADDLENDVNTITEKQRQKLRDFTTKSIPIADHQLYIGTPHHFDTIYDLLEKGRGFETYKRAVYNIHPPHNDGGLAWPERCDEEWIQQRRLGEVEWIEGEAVFTPTNTSWFDSQYLLKPATISNTVFDWNYLKEYNAELEFDHISSARLNQPIFKLNGYRVLEIRAYWDEATGLQGRDDSVVACAIRTEQEEIYLHDILKLSPIDDTIGYQKQAREVLEFCQRNHCTTIWVESLRHAVMHAAIKDEIARSNGLHLNVMQATRPSTRSKQQYIHDKFDGLMAVGKLHVHKRVSRTDFRTQFASFPHGRRDDFVDAAAGAIGLCHLGRVLIGAKPIVPVTPNSSAREVIKPKVRTLAGMSTSFKHPWNRGYQKPTS